MDAGSGAGSVLGSGARCALALARVQAPAPTGHGSTASFACLAGVRARAGACASCGPCAHCGRYWVNDGCLMGDCALSDECLIGGDVGISVAIASDVHVDICIGAWACMCACVRVLGRGDRCDRHRPYSLFFSHFILIIASNCQRQEINNK